MHPDPRLHTRVSTLRACSGEPHFPVRLRRLEHVEFVEAEGPLALRLDDLGPRVAIVGTRRPPQGACPFAFELAAELASAGCVIVSGGAAGIDIAAHKGALSVEGGSTIAVLGGGVDQLFPDENVMELTRIRETGALVAIKPRGIPAVHPGFLHRNLVIAALADHVVLVAAPHKSGARNTISHARKLKREVWAVTGAPWDDRMSGCLADIQLGARPLTRPLDLLVALGIADKKQLLPSPPNPLRAALEIGSETGTAEVTLTMPLKLEGPLRSSNPPKPVVTLGLILPAPQERQVLEVLAEGLFSIDELVLRTGLAVGPLRALLLTWTVEGVVREGPAGLFSLSNV